MVEETFGVNEERLGAVPVLHVTGEIDLATAPSLRERLESLFGSQQCTVVVDLLGVTFLDSTGLGVLVGAMKECEEAGGALKLAASSPNLLKVFEITGLLQSFSIYPTTQEAVAAAVPPPSGS